MPRPPPDLEFNSRLPAQTQQQRRRRKTIEVRSEEHTSELQSLAYLVCRLLLEKKNHTAKLTGSGTFYHDGIVYSCLHLWPYNSGSTGTFISKMRSVASRTNFHVPEAFSTKAVL